MLPFSALLGLTVDTCCCQSTSSSVSFPYTAQCLVRPWIQILRPSTENFTFSHVIWWITDPEVDSRPYLFPYTVLCLVRSWIQVLRQSTESFRLFYVSGWTRLLRTILVLLCGLPVPQILEQIVEVSLFSMRLLHRLMTCPLACRFLRPCTQVHGRADPRHHFGEGVAGTPGACSQVFCHPISCTSARAWTDTPCCESSEPRTHKAHTRMLGLVHGEQPTVFSRRKSECLDTCTDAPPTIFLHTKNLQYL